MILNDEQIIELDNTKSKIKDRPAKGYISFQDEAKRIWYRNVHIKELKYKGHGLGALRAGIGVRLVRCNSSVFSAGDS